MGGLVGGFDWRGSRLRFGVCLGVMSAEEEKLAKPGEPPPISIKFEAGTAYLTLSVVGSSAVIFLGLASLVGVGGITVFMLWLTSTKEFRWDTPPFKPRPLPMNEVLITTDVVIAFVATLVVLVCLLYVLLPIAALLMRKYKRNRLVEHEIERLTKQATVSAGDVSHVYQMIRPGASMARPNGNRKTNRPAKSRVRM